MSERIIFRPKSNFFWGILALALDALFVLQSALYPGATWLDFTIGAIVAAAASLCWIRPKLILRETDLVVVNPIRKVAIQYVDILELNTKWSLQIIHRNGKVRVWVAPASGKRRWISESTSRWLSDRLPTSSGRTTEVTSMSNSYLSDSGAAAILIQNKIDQLH
jgi:hypothetical protein